MDLKSRLNPCLGKICSHCSYFPQCGFFTTFPISSRNCITCSCTIIIRTLLYHHGMYFGCTGNFCYSTSFFLRANMIPDLKNWWQQKLLHPGPLFAKRELYKPLELQTFISRTETMTSRAEEMSVFLNPSQKNLKLVLFCPPSSPFCPTT